MKLTMQQRQWVTLALITVLITICMVIYSEKAFDAAVEGLKIWWEIVFPALLPFFILAELLMGLGVVHAMGALLEPLMRPVFRVPGVGAFAMAMGLASGYPIGAKITGQLRRKKLCSRIEGERLLAFTNTADPLFMIGAVAVGMFKEPAIGYAIAGAHYVSSLCLGIIMRFYGRKQEKEETIKETAPRRNNILKQAFYALLEARKNDGRSLGQLLGDSIRDSVNTLLLIGGFIILFSVITEILTAVGIVTIMTKIIMFILAPFGIVESMILPIIGGLFEITNGADLAAKAAAPLFQRVMICSGIIAWSGFSVHAQVATMINGTDIRIIPYILARVIHAILAALSTFLFLSPATNVLAPVHLPIYFNKFPYSPGFLNRFGYLFNRFLLILGIMLAISLILAIIQRIQIITFHYKE
ncbi:sporulation integral membrane protein YlbJ [Anoxybacter fermentans]|uniref:Sporulation integral membrane protein YlbJ n=1 Tax=Anoxybacter fermentans TaxID=1323375 RepID=A0A3Q9HPN3_9FIRM|nr:sporulation integral membrane protein YlbJ [Anoxybacter fermentans]AZR72728.1 sporulation integral membrane protein YlbJ [Anoxybacter fermentans]